jgi:hypothetical protein
VAINACRVQRWVCVWFAFCGGDCVVGIVVSIGFACWQRELVKVSFIGLHPAGGLVIALQRRYG